MQRLEPLVAEGSWPAILVRFRIGFVFGMSDRTGELRLSNRADLDETKGTWKVMHPKGEDTYGDKGAELDIFTNTRPFVVDFLEAMERRLRALGLDPAKVEPLCPHENGEHYTEGGWRGQRDKVFHRIGVQPNDDERALRRNHGKHVVEALQAKGHKEGSIIELGSKRLRNGMQTFQNFYADLMTIKARKVIADAYESFSTSGKKGGLDSA